MLSALVCSVVISLAGILDISTRIQKHLLERDLQKCRIQWDSVPGHHVFNNLQAFKTAFSFHFVPIPGVSNLAHGVKLRLTNLRRAMLQRPGIFVFVAAKAPHGRRSHRTSNAGNTEADENGSIFSGEVE
jgi:hypothetical protein